MTDHRRPVRLFVAALVIVGAISGCATEVRQPFVAGGQPSSTAPTLRPQDLVDMSREEFIALVVAQRGRPVVINVWASWCGPCRVESPMLADAAIASGDRVAFIGVDSGDSMEAGREFIEHYNLSYPSARDVSGGISTLLEVASLPTTVFVDRDGRVAGVVRGSLSEQALAARLAELTAAP